MAQPAQDNRLIGPWLQLLLFPVALALTIAPLLLLGGGLAQQVLGAIAIGLLLLAWARWVERAGPGHFGLAGDFAFFRDLVWGLIIGLLAVGAIVAVSFVLGLADISVSTSDVSATTLIPGLLRTLSVGFWEEMLFRGFLLVTLTAALVRLAAPAWALWLSVLASSLLFALAHASTDGFGIAAFCGLALNGVVWCLAFLRSGRLALPVGMHAAWNFAQLHVFGLSMSGNTADASLVLVELAAADWWMGGSYGPEAGLGGALGMAVMLALTFAGFPRDRETATPPPWPPIA